MEEDIKILEHIAIAYKEDEKINGSLVNINTSTLITNRELAQAIENVLNRLEQLEKENKELKATLKCTQDSWFEDTKKIEEYKEYIKRLGE